MAMAETDVYRERFEMPPIREGLDQRRAMEIASDMAGPFNDLVDRVLLAAYRRQQELTWIDHLVTHIEVTLEETGIHDLPQRVPAIRFLDLAGYTRLTSGEDGRSRRLSAQEMSLTCRSLCRKLSYVYDRRAP